MPNRSLVPDIYELLAEFPDNCFTSADICAVYPYMAKTSVGGSLLNCYRGDCDWADNQPLRIKRYPTKVKKGKNAYLYYAEEPNAAPRERLRIDTSRIPPREYSGDTTHQALVKLIFKVLTTNPAETFSVENIIRMSGHPNRTNVVAALHVLVKRPPSYLDNDTFSVSRTKRLLRNSEKRTYEYTYVANVKKGEVDWEALKAKDLAEKKRVEDCRQAHRQARMMEAQKRIAAKKLETANAN